MHEYGVAQSILNAVEDVRAARGLGRIEQVTVELGEFNGVEAVLLKSAFEDLTAAASSRRLQLNIRTVPLQACCNQCERDFDVAGFRFECPQCAGRDVRIVRGEELRLVSVLTKGAV